jgi:hypothetical protein
MTNGILLPRYWESLSEFVKSRSIQLSISIDAASEEVYVTNRRGGTWKGIQDALQYASELRESDQVGQLSISFVTQENNFRQIKDFCEMGIKFNVDYLQFQIIEPDFLRDLHPENYFEEWAKKAVHEATHPDHQELVEILQDEYFSQFPIDTNTRKQDELPVLALGQLLNIRNGVDISQYDNNLEESKRVKSQRLRELQEAHNHTLVKKGLLKDVWYEGKTHFIQLKYVKKINNTHVVQLENGEILKWDNDDDIWVECSKESLEYKEYSLQ